MRFLTALSVGLCLLAWNTAIAQASENAAKMDQGLAMMKEEAAKLGAPRSEGILLFFGSTKINGNYTIVDAVKDKHGCVATIFVKKDDDFIRISTNVQKEGNRAVGTKLDPSGKAIVAVRKGETYRGEADILGMKHDTIYEPIKNDKDEVVGIYFVGFPK